MSAPRLTQEAAPASDYQAALATSVQWGAALSDAGLSGGGLPEGLGTDELDWMQAETVEIAQGEAEEIDSDGATAAPVDHTPGVAPPSAALQPAVPAVRAGAATPPSGPPRPIRRGTARGKRDRRRR